MSLLAAFIATMASAPPVVALPATIVLDDIEIDPASASTTLRVKSDGVLEYEYVSGGPVVIQNWITPTSAAGAAYEARLVTGSGTLSSGTADTWQALSSTRSYDVTRSSVGDKVFVGTLQIRQVSDGTVLAVTNTDGTSLSATVTI